MVGRYRILYSAHVIYLHHIAIVHITGISGLFTTSRQLTEESVSLYRNDSMIYAGLLSAGPPIALEHTNIHRHGSTL